MKDCIGKLCITFPTPESGLPRVYCGYMKKGIVNTSPEIYQRK